MSLAVQHSPTSPTYALAPHDEVIVNGVSYRSAEKREGGYIFVHADQSGVAQFFDNGKLVQLVQRGRLRHNRGAFLPAEARRRLDLSTTLVSAAPDDITERCKFRLAFVQAFLDFEALGEVKRTHTSLKKAMPALQDRATKILGLNLGESGRCKVELKAKEVSTSALFAWLKAYKIHGVSGLFDAYSRCGYRARRLGAEELSVMGPLVARFAREKVTQKVIIDDVNRAFAKINEERVRAGKTDLLEVPSRETIRQAIKRLDPFQVYIAHNGEAAARKKFAPVGRGLDLTRPLQRVEIDEWTIDLFSLLAEAGLLERLTPGEKRDLKLGKAVRWKLTVAICATTRCILAMRLSLAASAMSAIQTIDAIISDKGHWADAFGALSPWDMAGVPELIVTDCGSAFISHETIAALQDLGIRNERAPAGLPEMRARIERFFRTAIFGLVTRLTGRTFSSVVERGDADPQVRAALTTDDLSEALVRWVVDVYHNTPHEGLNGETPAACWRRLSDTYGVLPPPDMGRRRLVFGTRMTRKMSKKGVRVLGIWYHSEALARWSVHKTALDVQVRWHPQDIGAVAVRIDDDWIEVPAVHEGFDGVRAETWLETVRHLRASHHRQAELSAHIVRQAIEQIEAINARAMARQGLVIKDWSETQLQAFEDRLMIGFEVSSAPQGAEPTSSGKSSDMGLCLPTAGDSLAALATDDPVWSADSVSELTKISPRPFWSSADGPGAPDDDWTNVRK